MPDLAGAYQANGQVKEAVALLEQVVAIQAQTLAEDHPSRLASQHALAIAYEANGQVKEAVALLEQVVAIKAKTLAEDHPSRLASQQWLEYILEAANRDELDYNVSGSH
jgi:tetratricopeptide (TPR) repeat protein